MGYSHDRILLVEHDPVICDLIFRQALQAIGYQVQVVGDATIALAVAEKFQPDLILVDLNLPGLSGKDLLIALRTQGIETPVVVIAAVGLENEVIQAFRLGASDSLAWPAREAEVVAVVERVLKQVHEKRERVQVAQQLHRSNQELQNRVRELTSVFAAGKAILALDDPRGVNDRILDWAVKVSGAERGWLLLREDPAKKSILAAAKNMPPEIKLNQAWEDDISTLAGLTGESIAVSGESLSRYKAASLGQAVVVTPLKVQKQTVALLGVARKSARAFTESEQNMLKAIAEYTSQALINLRLVRVYEERTRSLQHIAESAQAGEKAKAEILLKVIHELKTLNEAANTSLKQLVDMPPASLPGPARQNAALARDKLAQAVRVIDLVRPLTQSNLSRQAPSTNASEVARQVAARLQRLAQQKGVALASELPPAPMLVLADPAQLYQILEGLIVNAIHVSLPGEKVYTHLEKSGEWQACLTVRDSGPGIEARDLPHIFDHNPTEVENQTNRSPVESLSLPLIKELVSAYGGSIWVESKLGKGSAFHFTLPTPS